MGRIRVGLLPFFVVLGLALWIGACDAGRADSKATELGQLHLPLQAVSPAALQYRLEQGTFSIDGPALDPDSPMLVSTEDNPPGVLSINVDLPVGDYTVSLLSGWRMLRHDEPNDTWSLVEATLVSEAIAVSIAETQVSRVIFVFNVPDSTLSFGEGEIVIEPRENGECPSGFTHCGVGCVDLLVTLTHCGDCGQACGFPHASAACSAGACGLNICQPGFENCDGVANNGCEVDLAIDVANCGSCEAFCQLGETCEAGVCQGPVCGGTTADCDGDPANGCEVDLGTDGQNCGLCGNDCQENGRCEAASCVACLPNFANCDGDSGNGCEVDLTADPADCGSCGASCQLGETCEAGACEGPVCGGTTANCDGDPANGCEVDVRSDRANCGGCGIACALGESCAASVCQLATCSDGFEDCDGDLASGCEVDLNNDDANCGACGNVCGRVWWRQTHCIGGACVR